MRFIRNSVWLIAGAVPLFAHAQTYYYTPTANPQTRTTGVATTTEPVPKGTVLPSGSTTTAGSSTTPPPGVKPPSGGGGGQAAYGGGSGPRGGGYTGGGGSIGANYEDDGADVDLNGW